MIPILLLLLWFAEKFVVQACKSVCAHTFSISLEEILEADANLFGSFNAACHHFEGEFASITVGDAAAFGGNCTSVSHTNLVIKHHFGHIDDSIQMQYTVFNLCVPMME